MALTGEEIRQRLSVFAARWSVYDGGERSEAQTFLNELFECYGTRRSDVARFEEAPAGRFLDLIWPEICLIEMKAPAETGRRRSRLLPESAVIGARCDQTGSAFIDPVLSTSQRCLPLKSITR